MSLNILSLNTTITQDNIVEKYTYCWPISMQQMDLNNLK